MNLDEPEHVLHRGCCDFDAELFMKYRSPWVQELRVCKKGVSFLFVAEFGVSN